MPRSGFEPESSDRKSEMIGRTTPPGRLYENKWNIPISTIIASEVAMIYN